MWVSKSFINMNIFTHRSVRLSKTKCYKRTSFSWNDNADRELNQPNIDSFCISKLIRHSNYHSSRLNILQIWKLCCRFTCYTMYTVLYIELCDGQRWRRGCGAFFKITKFWIKKHNILRKVKYFQNTCFTE